MSTETFTDLEETSLEQQARLDTEVTLNLSEQTIVDHIVARLLTFIDEMAGHDLFPYQRTLAARVVESLVISDGEEITAVFSRQAGKSETVANLVAGCMVLFPLLAPIYPKYFSKYKNGFWVGCFAPVSDQAETLFSRICTRLMSDSAMALMADPDINDRPKTGDRVVRLPRLGSLCRMQTAHPKAKIEGRTYHLAVIDEDQDTDDIVINKSVRPMLAFNNGTIVKIGTPAIKKNNFYRSIQYNKRRQNRRGAKQNHFESDWKVCARYNPHYGRFVKKELLRLGEDSDEFQLSYALRWLLDRGMFVTTTLMDELGDTSMNIVPHYFLSPVLVGIDPARTMDSTVVTVVHVDWDKPDEFGLYNHRVLNWLELHGDSWEDQYHRIVAFLAGYRVLAVAVDSQGVGDAVAGRMEVLLAGRGVEVKSLKASRKEQSVRWTHLMGLLQRGKVTWPASPRVRKTKTFRRFYQQMVDLEKKYEGPYLTAAAPKERDAHDDFPDSLALAVSLTAEMSLPEVEVSNAPFWGRGTG